MERGGGTCHIFLSQKCLLKKKLCKYEAGVDVSVAKDFEIKTRGTTTGHCIDGNIKILITQGRYP